MKQGEIVVVAIAPHVRGVHVYGGFADKGEAVDFVASDVIPERYTELAIVPVWMTELVDKEE